MHRLLALLPTLLLFGCVLTPGKFVSALTLNADRSFAFTYKGEVIALDPTSAMNLPVGDKADKAGDATKEGEAKQETRNRAIAEALAKEAGYRSVTYEGKGRFAIDYAIEGRLTHGFVFPFNSDAEAMFPFLAIELRRDGLVRVRAPGFAGRQGGGDASAMTGGAAADSAHFLDGRFTVTTDAEIVSQNSEDGASVRGAIRTISWRATPLTRDAPTATLRLKP